MDFSPYLLRILSIAASSCSIFRWCFLAFSSVACFFISLVSPACLRFAVFADFLVLSVSFRCGCISCIQKSMVIWPDFSFSYRNGIGSFSSGFFGFYFFFGKFSASDAEKPDRRAVPQFFKKLTAYTVEVICCVGGIMKHFLVRTLPELIVLNLHVNV